ncbi:MAG: efflux RND transporter periplasmic adaptor subunit [Phycisphaerae bacterium]|jgi:RND family efflux transporter MFP subunit
MTGKLTTFLIVGLVAGLLAGAGGFYAVQQAGFLGAPIVQPEPVRDDHAEPDEHEGQDHAEHAGEDEHDEDGHEEGHEEGHEPGVVHLTPEKLASLHIEPVEIREGALTSVIELPGQVEWNTDRLVHVTPRVPGVVVSVEKTLGDQVNAGDLLCVLDSREMGDAKMEYLADLSRFEVAKADFERARTVFENTQKLLAILDADPTPEQALEQAQALEIGENKNKLLTAYTAMHVTQRTFERARTLIEKGVGTEQDLLEAQGAYETARADYVSTREEIAFSLRPNFLRAERDFDVARTEMRNSERALHILGLTNEQTAALTTQAAEIDEDIARNALHSPIDGVIVERHLTRGELVDTETKLYTIADLSDVWVMGRVYERDIRQLKQGQKATVRLDAFPDQLFEGVVDFIGSQLDPSTRTVEARVVLPNPDSRFRPGMFGMVSVFSEATADAGGLLVPMAALQRLAAGHVVFEVVGEGEYRQVPVQVVAQSKEFAQVTGELQPGMRVAVGDTFVLKSEAGKEAMGGGHSH